MSTTIDEKVVEMRFDNRNFEQNVSQTMSTLDKFKQKLNLTGASKGLESLNTQAKNVNFNPLNSAIETVSTRFSALQVVGVTTLANITNSAVNAAKQILNSLTIAPVKDGFQEYEMMLNTVQTTMSATGKTAKEVEEELKKLDEYADQTVYSTADMMNNLPKFTNAGVELEKATQAMIGIANATALAGGDAGKASIAFYNLGQAIGTGYLTRMDYNSINNAGIATMEWKNQMVEAAIAQGTLVKVGEDAYQAGNKTLTLQQLFIDGLQEQWATTDVMMKVFGDYGDATTEIGKKSYAAAQDIKTYTMMMDSLKATAGTGWKDTWQILIGDLDTAKKFWTGINNFISKYIESFADWRNGILDGALNLNPFEGVLDKISKITDTAKTALDTLDSLDEIAKRVINMEFKTTDTGRRELLMQEGYNWAKVQNRVNEMLGNSVRHSEDAAEAELKLYQAQHGIVKQQEDINDARETTIEQLIAMSDAELEAIGFTKEEIKAFRELGKVAEATGVSLEEIIKNPEIISGRNLIINSFKNIGKVIGDSLGAIKDAWRDIFPAKSIEDRAQSLYNIIAAIHKFSAGVKDLVVKDGELTTTGKNLLRTFKGLFAAIDIVTSIAGGGFRIAFKLLREVLSYFNVDILSVTASIGDAIVSFRDWVKSTLDINKALDKIVPFIKNTVNAIKEWIVGLKETDNIPKYILDGLVNELKAGVSKVWDTALEIGKAILDSIEEFLEIDSPSKKFIEVGKYVIAGLIKGLQNGLSTLWEIVKGVAEKLVDILGEIDWGAVFAGAIVVGFLVMGIKLANAIENVTAPLGGIGDVLESTSKAINSFSLAIKAHSLLTIAKAIGILAASIVVLSLLDPVKLWNSVGILAALALVVGGLTVAIGKLGPKDAVELGKFSLALIGISGSLLILAIAIRQISGIGEADLKKAGVAILAMAAVVAGLVAATKLFNKDAANVGVTLLLMSAAILLMVHVAKKVSEIDRDSLLKGGTSILAFGGIIAGLIAISKIGGKNINGLGSTMMLIATSLLLMVVVTKLVSKMDRNTLDKGASTILAFGGIIAGLIMATRLVSGKDLKGVGSTILAVSTAMLILASVVKIVGGMETGALIKGVVAVTVLAAIIVGLVAATKLVTTKDLAGAASTILAMSIAIGILAGVAALLSLVSVENLVKGITAVGVLTTMIALLTASTWGAKDVKGTIIAMTVAIALLVGAMVALTFIDTEKLAKSATALGVILGTFAMLIKSTSTMKSGNLGTLLGTCVILTAVVAALGGILYLLSGMPNPESIVPIATGLAILLTSLSASMVLLSMAKGTTLDSVGVAAAMGLVVAELAVVLGLFSENIENPDRLIPSALALSTLLLVMAGVTAILGLVGPAAAGAFAGAVAMAEVLVVIAGIVGAMGLLMQLPGVEKMLKDGGAGLELLGIAIGKFIGGIVGGIADGVVAGVASSLPALGTALTDFMEKAEGFFKSVGDIDSDVLAGTGILTASILLLTAADFVAGIFTVGGLGLIALGFSLSEFAKASEGFLSAMSNIEPSVLTGVEVFSSAVLKLTAASVLDGLSKMFGGGESSLGAFSAQLPELGTNIKKFVENLGTISDTNSVTAACGVITALGDVAKKLPREGGEWQRFFGEQSFASFGKQLPGLAEDLNGFVSKLGKFENSDSVEAACGVVIALAEAAKNLPRDNGVWQVLFGDHSLSKFGKQLPGLAEDLNGFVGKLEDFDDTKVTTVECAGLAINALADAASKLDGQSDWAKKLFGDNGLGAFGGEVTKFGEGLRGFVDSLGEFTTKQVTTVSSAVKAINALAGISSDTVYTFVDYGADLAVELPGFGTAVKDFCVNMPSAESAKSATTSIQSILDILPKISNANSGALTTFADNLKNVGTDAMDKFISAFTNSTVKTELYEAAQTLADKIVKGFEVKKVTVRKAGEALAEKAVSGMDTQKEEAESAGKDLGAGLVLGIEAKEQAAYDAGYALGQAAVQGEKDGQESESPSKATKRAGVWLGEGLILGIKQMGSAVYKAGSGLGEKATGTISSAISKISDFINTDIDAEPVIRPVLDLSDVQAGAGAINGLFSGNSSIGVLANVGAIGASMNQRNQNGRNDDVVSAIDKLNKNIGNVGGPTYQFGNITYDNGSEVANAVGQLIRALKIEGRA